MYRHNIRTMIDALVKGKFIPKEKHDAACDYLRAKCWTQSIAIVWDVEDVIEHAKNMGRKGRVTKGEATVVLEFLLDHHDATQGISWDTVEYAINHICGTES